VDTVRAIREAVGPSVELMCDANSAHTLATARRFVEQVADCDLVGLEEPIPPDDLDGYVKLSDSSPVPARRRRVGVLGVRLSRSRCWGALAYAQPDIARCGGFTGALQIASLCYAYDVPVCPHTGFSGGINNLASAFLAATVPQPGPLEHMIIGNPLRDVFTEPLPDPHVLGAHPGSD
jgi:D-galactarolactone cycloisomerase